MALTSTRRGGASPRKSSVALALIAGVGLGLLLAALQISGHSAAHRHAMHAESRLDVGTTLSDSLRDDRSAEVESLRAKLASARTQLDAAQQVGLGAAAHLPRHALACARGHIPSAPRRGAVRLAALYRLWPLGLRAAAVALQEVEELRAGAASGAADAGGCPVDPHKPWTPSPARDAATEMPKLAELLRKIAINGEVMAAVSNRNYAFPGGEALRVFGRKGCHKGSCIDAIAAATQPACLSRAAHLRPELASASANRRGGGRALAGLSPAPPCLLTARPAERLPAAAQGC